MIYHSSHDTLFDNVPKYDMYSLVDEWLVARRIDNDAEIRAYAEYSLIESYSPTTTPSAPRPLTPDTVKLVQCLELIFSGLHKFLKEAKKGIDSNEDTSFASALRSLIKNDIAVVGYILYYNTKVIPVGADLHTNLMKSLGIRKDVEDSVIDQCKNIIRKHNNEYYICDYNFNIDSKGNADTFLNNLNKFIQKKKIIAKRGSTSNLLSFVSDNIPVTSPYAIMILASIIKKMGATPRAR